MKTLSKILFLFLLLSSFSSAQWIQQSSGTQNTLINVYFLNENLGWCCGYNGTILKTTNSGIDWVSKNIGTVDDVHDIFFIDSLKGWAILYEFSPFRHGSIIYSTDGGNSWNVQLTIWDYTFHSIYFLDANNGWVAGSNGIMFRTSNGGISWVQQYPPTSGAWLWPVFFIDSNVGWTAGDPLFGIYKSNNGGISWSTYSVPIVERIHSLVFINHQTGWLCGTQGQIAKSLDGGITWENLQSGTNVTLRDISLIDNNHLWCVGYNGTVLNTIDGGSNWIQQYSGTSYNLFGVHFIDQLNGWVVGENGVILNTTNGGIPVELISFSIEQEKNEILLHWNTSTETNNYGFEIQRKFFEEEWCVVGFIPGYGTTSEKHNYQFENQPEKNGIYSYRLKQIDFDGTFKYSDEVKIEYMPIINFNLEQNYPNPFNPTTSIRYSIPERQFVTLKIYSSLGEMVSSLVNDDIEAGIHEAVFDGSNFPTGVYFYNLTAGNFTQSKKLILIK